MCRSHDCHVLTYTEPSSLEVAKMMSEVEKLEHLLYCREAHCGVCVCEGGGGREFTHGGVV